VYLEADLLENGQAVFRFRVPRAGTVDLSVHAVSGKTLWRTTEGVNGDGVEYVRWEGSAAAVPGKYIVRLRQDGKSMVQRFAITH
jgi:hypothetical protein